MSGATGDDAPAGSFLCVLSAGPGRRGPVPVSDGPPSLSFLFRRPSRARQVELQWRFAFRETFERGGSSRRARGKRSERRESEACKPAKGARCGALAPHSNGGLRAGACRRTETTSDEARSIQLSKAN